MFNKYHYVNVIIHGSVYKIGLRGYVYRFTDYGWVRSSKPRDAVINALNEVNEK